MSVFKGIVMRPDGTIEAVQVDDYRGIQAAVGGCFDLVTSETGETSFWVHDEGKLIGLLVNLYATAALWRLNERFKGYDFLCGNVLISGGADDEGETLSISAEGISIIRKMVGNPVRSDDPEDLARRTANEQVLRSVEVCT